MKTRCFFFVQFCLISFSLFSQDAQNGQNVEEEEEVDFTRYIINYVDFDITGITRQFAIINKTEIKIGDELTGMDELERYVADKNQLLINTRLFDHSSIEYTLGDALEDGTRPVELLIIVKDTRNRVAIPRPLYTSNSGLDITIKARDYNFLGTMYPLRLDLGYRYDLQKRSYYNFLIDTDTPFRLFGLDWNLNFDNTFEWRPHFDQSLYFKNNTGLSVQFPINKTTLVTGYTASFLVNEENDDKDKPLYGDYQEGLYILSRAFTYWNIPTGLEVFGFGQLYYVPQISVEFPHELPVWSLQEHRKKTALSFFHYINFGRIDWIGNFQNGFYFYAGNTYEYNFRSQDNERPYDINFNIKTIFHKNFEDYFGISARLMYRHHFFDYLDESAADVLRGIKDDIIYMNYMLSLNLDFPVRIIKFLPDEWLDFGNFKPLHFDFHLSPILDMALYRRSDTGIDFSFDNVLITGGLEALIFPHRWRSLYLRISVGKMIKGPPSAGGLEIYIGTDLQF